MKTSFKVNRIMMMTMMMMMMIAAFFLLLGNNEPYCFVTDLLGIWEKALWCFRQLIVKSPTTKMNQVCKCLNFFGFTYKLSLLGFHFETN